VSQIQTGSWVDPGSSAFLLVCGQAYLMWPAFASVELGIDLVVVSESQLEESWRGTAAAAAAAGVDCTRTCTELVSNDVVQRRRWELFVVDGLPPVSTIYVRFKLSLISYPLYTVYLPIHSCNKRSDKNKNNKRVCYDEIFSKRL